MKHSKGFTLIELVVVIAILGILASIAIVTFSRVTSQAKGSQIIANMYVCEDTINIYYTRNSNFPENVNSLIGTHFATWPKPPIGQATIIKNNGEELRLTVHATNYVYVKPSSNSLTEKVGRITLGGMTIEEILSTSATSLTLVDDE